jgi:hypothetical protein
MLRYLPALAQTAPTLPQPQDLDLVAGPARATKRVPASRTERALADTSAGLVTKTHSGMSEAAWASVSV